MSYLDAIITFASWEDRFRLGLERLVAQVSPKRVLMFYLAEYADWSAANRDGAERLCRAARIEFASQQLSVEAPAENWHILLKSLSSHIANGKQVMVDLTTMPREIIWTTFWMLDLIGVQIEYAYFRPEEYGPWLSREPQRPRLVFKMSGITRLQSRTALVALAGYDVDRTKQLVTFFEPEITLLGLQTQDFDPSNEAQMLKQRQHLEKVAEDNRTTWFDVDAYASDCGQSILSARVEQFFETHNVVMSSLGPKLSSVAMYRLHRMHRSTALAYTPSKEFNREYSKGIGKGVFGVL